MTFSPLIDRLIEGLRCLPGVGPKSAQRMALHLLERDRRAGLALADALRAAMEGVGRCRDCNTFTETELCRICSNPRRDPQVLCVVETPSDVLAIEQTGTYSGRYFVLMGHLSPIDGIGPEEIGVNRLLDLADRLEVGEVILATNPTVEGEATAQYIAELLRRRQVLVTRIAHGVPLGGELGLIDGGTLSHAFQGRKPLG